MENNRPLKACKKVVIVGAGLAGSEAALSLANLGHNVILLESKTLAKNPAQKTDKCCELVCTNSLKSTKETTAHGLLKREMQSLGSTIIRLAFKHSVPAGDTLAVDRESFAQSVTETLENHPRIELIASDVTDPEKVKEEFFADVVILATGPLTNAGLSRWLEEELAPDDLYFYDAIAPVVDADSLNFDKLYFKDRYKDDSTDAAYLNAPMNKEEYERFISEIQKAEKTASKDFEEMKFFESCLPIDIMVERGADTPRFSCMKPVGLELPWGERPYAVVQLRRENLLGTAYNLVGFQTRLTYGEQKRVFRLIPGLEDAQFIHLGSVHRNTFLHAAKVLNRDMSTKKFPWLYFAGQITGVEGYTESAASGLYVAHQIDRSSKGDSPLELPVETCLGALINYIMTAVRAVPTNVHFGLLPPIEGRAPKKLPRSEKKMWKKHKIVERHQEVMSKLGYVEGAQG